MKIILQEEIPKQDWCSGEQYRSSLPVMTSVLTWFEVLGYTVLTELDRSLGQFESEANREGGVILHDRLSQSLRRVNPDVPQSTITTAIQQLTSSVDGSLFWKNYQVHTWLTQGMLIPDQLGNQQFSQRIWLVDRDHLLNNDWLVVQSLIATENGHSHCLDLVVFINGLPLAVIQGLAPKRGPQSLSDTYQQVQSFKQALPTLMTYNTMLVMTDGEQARVGTLTSNWQEFMPWLTIDGEVVPVTATTELDVLVQGIFDRRRLLELVQYFIWFEQRGLGIHKAIANYPTCPLPNADPCHRKFND